MYLKGYNFDDDNVRIDIPVGLCNTYDIPESGSVTDSHGRHITISSNTQYGQYENTLFKLDAGVKFTGIYDAVTTIQEFIPSFGINLEGEAKAIYDALGAPSRITPDQQDTSGTIAKPYINFSSSDTYWYPESGTAQNFSYKNGFPVPSGSFFMAYYTGNENDEYGGYYYGIVTFTTYSGGAAWSEVEISRCTEFNAISWGIPGRSPGEKGFRPIGDYSDKTIGGGDDSGWHPGYKHQDIPQPGEPDETSASAVKGGFVNVYDITEANLMNVGKCLYSSTLLTALQNIMVNPLDGIVSLNIFPCKPHLGTSETIKILNHDCATADLGVNASGFKLAKQFKTVDFGSVKIDEEWKSFLDYAATSVTLYLPFIGEVDLPADEAIDATINVQYTIDFLTGMCVANVKTTKFVNISAGGLVSGGTQHSYQGNCAVSIPLTAVNYGNMVGSLVNAANVGLRSGIAGGVASLASDALSGGFKPTVTTKGTMSANAGFCAVLYPYIVVTRPIPAEPTSYQETIGYPSYIKGTIGEYQDLCVCDDIDCSGIVGATPNEINRIKQLCREGVYN